MARELVAPLAADYLTAAYLAATGLLAAASGSTTGLGLAAMHAAAIVLVYRQACRPLPGRRWSLFARLVYPVAITPILYLELARLNQLHVVGYLDAAVVEWEQFLFGLQPSLMASQWYDALWLSEALHVGYVSYYLLIPGALVSAYLLKGPGAAERVAFATALAFFVCYLCFCVFPVAGPRYEFPSLSGPPAQGVAFGLVHRILEGGSSQGTAFPSSHVAATVAAWLAAGRESRRVFWIMAPFAVSLTLGTVYGRFHYAVDAAAGLAVAGLAVASTPWLMRRLGGTTAAALP